MKLILLLNILVLAVSLTSCTRKRKDFETAKPLLPGSCAAGNSTFLRARSGRVFDQEWTARRQTLGRNLAERSFARTLKSRSILRVAWWQGAKCVECAAEDEKQKLNEAMAEMHELTAPSKKTPTDPDQR
jgi:hypothetical protein